MTERAARGLVLAILAAAWILPSGSAGAQDTTEETRRFIEYIKAANARAAARTEPLLKITIGTHRLWREAQGVQRVAVGDPEVADVRVVNRRELLITGKRLGTTNLHVWSEGRAREYQLRVVPTDSEGQEDGAQIIGGRELGGRLPNLIAHARARQQALAGAERIVDSSAVAVESQVLTEIKIAEVSRTAAQQYGLNFLRNAGQTTFGITRPGTQTGVRFPGVDPATGVPTDSYQLNGDNTLAVPLQNAFNLVIGSLENGALGILSLLESKGLARILAEPSLTAMSGQTASFLAGGEFPVPVAQGNTGAVTVQYKEFGVRLTLSPTVLDRNRIALKVAPEVSDLNFAAAVSIGGVSVPSLTVRRTDTTVELADGESFVISGLVSTSLLTNVEKIPWLGDLPILGAFFRSTRLARDERELIMVVTPRLVRPIPRGTPLPPLPGSRYEAYRPGMGQLVFGEKGEFRTPSTGFSR